MTPFYVRVTLACGARGLYFENGRCVEAANELNAYRALEWPQVRLRLQRQRLVYRVFVSPRDQRVVSPDVDAPPVTNREHEHLAALPRSKQRLMSWGR